MAFGTPAPTAHSHEIKSVYIYAASTMGNKYVASHINGTASHRKSKTSRDSVRVECVKCNLNDNPKFKDIS